MSASQRPVFRASLATSVICFLLAITERPYAADNTWTAGSAADFDWTNASNWSAGVPLASDDVLLPFLVPNPGTLANPQRLALSSGSQANSLSVSGSYEFTGGVLEIGSGNVRITMGHSLIMNTQLTGADGLTLTGGGTLRLTNSLNDYTGVTNINNGTLVIDSLSQLGADTSPISINGSASRGFGGGSLVIDSAYGESLDFTRELVLQGYGPISDRGSAFISIGSNTISTDVLYGEANVATGIHSTAGMLTISGDLISSGSGQIRFGTVNSTGVGSYRVTGEIVSAGNLEKLGGGTLILEGNNSSFTGSVLVNAGSVRVANGAALGLGTANGSLTLGGGAGTLEIRTNVPESFASRRLSMGTSSNATLFLDHEVGGGLLNQTVLLAPLTLTAGSTTRTLSINSRNGYGVTFVGDSIGGGLGGNNNITINANGQVTFQGTFWNNTSTSARTLTLTVNTGALAVVTGSVQASGAAHILTKAGAGTLRLLGNDSTYTGATNISAGTLEIAHFGSINNDSGIINLGSTTSAATLSIVGNNLEAYQTMTDKVINLSGTTGTISVLANQILNSTGVVFNSDFIATGAGSKTLVLGGTSDASIANEIRGAIVDGSGTTALQKTGSNTWVLSGANDYSGGTTINNGILKIQDSFSGASRNILSDSATFGFGEAASTVGTAGGVLLYSGAAGESSLENIGVLSSISGAGTIQVAAGDAGFATLNISSLSQIAASSSVNFVAGANSTISMGGIGSAGLLGTNAYFNGADFAYAPSVGTSVLRAPLYDSDLGFVTATSALVADSHNLLSADVNATDPITLKSLKIIGGSDPELSLLELLTINEAGAGTLGSILVTDGTSTLSGVGGVTSGTGALVIRVNEASDVLNLNTPIASSTTGGLTKTGAGALVVGAANAQTGTTSLLEGTIQLATGGRLSANSVNFTMRQGTVLDLNGVSIAQSSTTSSISIFNGAGTVTNTSVDPVIFAMTGSGGVFNGVIDETNGQISVVKMGTTSGQTFTGVSNYTGSTTIGVPGNGNTGSLTVSVLANIGQPSSIGKGDATDAASNAASLVFGGTTGGLTYTGNASVSTDRLFTLAGTGSSAGATITNNGVNNAALIFSNTGAIAFSGSSNQLFRLSGSSTADNWFHPQIINNDSAGATTRLSKVGTGMWILGNSGNSYTGTTSVEDGILQGQDGASLPSASGLVLGGTTSTTAVFQSSGVFTRNLSTVANAGTNTVSWNTTLTTGGGGFAASTDKLVVAIGGEASPTALNWNLDGFVKTGASLILNSINALSEVEFRNAINLNGATRTIVVNDNTSTFTDFATITGVISNSTGTAGLTKSGNGTLQLLGENTYNGVTSVSAGTLVVTSLGHSLTPGASSVGSTTNAATTTGAVTLGNAGTGGSSLQYIGQGETSNRMIRLNATTGTQQIHADGSGPIILTNVVNDMVAGAKTLALRGSNSMGNMITSDLQDNVGALTVTIDGGATWILTGNNGYTGNTNVSAGALGIGGDSAIGTGTLVLSSGSVFAHGADRVISNSVSQSNNSGVAFIGDYSISLTSTYALAATSSNPSSTANNITSGKTLTLADVTANAITAARTWTLTGAGNTIITGDISTTTSFGLNLSYTGNGLLELRGANTTGGNTTVNNTNGSLRLTGSGQLGSGNLTVAAGTLLIESLSQTVATLSMGAGAAGSSSLIDIGSGLVLSPSAISFSSTNNNETAIIRGDGTLNLGTGGITVTINNSTAADVDMAWEMDTLLGSGVFTKAGAGTLDIRGITNNLFTGGYQINAGSILGLDSLNNNIVLNGGVYEGSGSFTRALGSGSDQLQWIGSGGFAARGGALDVSLSGAADPLVWGGTPFFVPSGSSLIFGSVTADDVITFTHNIDLNGANRTIQVIDNTAITTDWAVLSGNLSNGSITKTGNGVLQLSGNNSFSSLTINGSSGVVAFSAAENLGGGSATISLQAGFLNFVGSSNLVISNAINIDPTTSGQTLGLQNLGANGTSGAVITFAGPIATGSNILTLTGSGKGIITAGITQTGTAADVYVTSGEWTLRGNNTLADDLVVQGSTSILNLDGTGIITHNTGTSSGLYSRNGGVINLLADDPFVEPGGLDFILLGDSGGTVPGTLNMNGFNLTTPRLDVGQVGADLSGIVLGTATLTVNTALNLYRGSVEVNLAGAGSAIKNGTGEVVLSGDNTDLTGSTAVTNGTLRLVYEDHNTRKIGSGTLSMNGGLLLLEGNSISDTFESVGGLTTGGGLGANTGASSIELRAGSGHVTDLAVGDITRSLIGGTLDFVLSSSAVSVSTSSINPDSLTSLGGWATVNETAFATINSGKIAAIASVAKDNVATWLATDNVIDSAGYSGTLGASAVNSIIFDAAAGSNLAIANDTRFSINSGGILVRADSGSAGISGGILTSGLFVGSSTSLTELIVHQHSSNDFTITSQLNGTLGLTKSGVGTLVVGGHNLYTGQTSINEGILKVSGGSAIGDRSVVNIRNRADAVLDLDGSSETIAGLTGGGTDGGKVSLNSGTLQIINNSGATTVFIGLLEGGGTLIKGGANTQELEGNSVGFTGDVIVNRGLLHLDAGSGALPSAASITVNGAELLDDQDQSGSRDRLGNSTVVTLNNTAGTRGLWIRTQSQNGSRADTVGSVILGAGHNVLQATNDGSASGTSQVSTLTINNFSRSGHATALVRGQNLGGGSGARGRLAVAGMPSGAIGGGGSAGQKNITIVPYLIGVAGTTSATTDSAIAAELGNTFVTWVSSSEGLRPLNLSTEYTSEAAGYEGVGTVSSDNVRFTTSTAGALTGGNRTINSLVLDSSSAALTVTGASSDTLTLSSGALLAATSTAANAITLNGFSELRTATDEYLIFVTNASNTLTLTPNLTSIAALTKSGAGTLMLTGSNSYNGGTWFNQGLIEAAFLTNLGAGSLNFYGGGLRWATSSTFDITSRTVTLGLGGAIFDTNGNDVVFNTSFGNGGLGGFSKVGTGNLILNATGNFSGPVTITAGSLIYGVANALPTTTDLTLNGGTLDIGSFTTTLGAVDFLINSTINGSADLTFTGDFNQSTGSRTLTVNNTGITTFDGDLMVITNASTTARTLTISPATGATVVVNSQITDGSALGALSKTGSGTLVLNAANFHTGTTTLNGGTTVIGNSDALGVASGGLTLTSGTLQGDGSGEKVVARNVSQGGTFVLSGEDKMTFTGTWLNNGGSRTLTVNGTGGVELAGQVNLSEHATTARTLTVNGSGSALISGVVSNGTGTGNSALIYSGTGSLTLSNANTYGGNTTVNGGTLLVMNTSGSATGTGNTTIAAAGTLGGSGRITGLVTLSGVLSPGGVDSEGDSLLGQLTVGTITANSGSSLLLQLGGATVSDPTGVEQYLANPSGFSLPSSWTEYEVGVTEHDQLYIENAGTPTLNTTVTISDIYLNGFVPQYGDVFQVVDWASLGTQSLAGTQTFDFPTMDWDTSLFSSAGIIIYVGMVPEPTRVILVLFGIGGLLFQRRRSVKMKSCLNSPVAQTMMD